MKKYLKIKEKYIFFIQMICKKKINHAKTSFDYENKKIKT